MAAGKPSTHSTIRSEHNEPARDSSEKQDVFHPDDPAVTDSRLAALVENTHVSGDLKLEKLAYLHEMLIELKKLAASVGEPMISYLIDMALIETSSAMQVDRFNKELKGLDE